MEWNRSSACTQGSCVEVAWERSSFCSSATNCVEVARPTWTVSSYCANGSCVQVRRPCGTGSCVVVDCQCQDGKVYVRDSKLGDASPVIVFAPDTWKYVLYTVSDSGTAIGVYKETDKVRWVGPTVEDKFGEVEFTYDEWDAFVKGVRAGEFTVSEGVSS